MDIDKVSELIYGSSMALISPYAVVDQSRNIFGFHCIIGDNVILGTENIIDPFAVIGTNGEMTQSARLHYIQQQGKILIGNGNHIGEFVVVHKPIKTSLTWIGDNCYIMACVHIAHDCFIENNVNIAPGAKLGGNVRVGRYSNIGLNASIHPNITIAVGTMIGMGAIITKSIIEPWRIIIGVNKDNGPNIVGKQKWGIE